MTRRLAVIAGLMVLLALSFLAGRQVERHIYLDACLDLGGGMNPGGYPICVIEK